MTEGDLAMKLVEAKAEIEALKTELVSVKKTCKTCANELCLRCGRYRDEHLGACNGCRWMSVRKMTTDAN